MPGTHACDLPPCPSRLRLMPGLAPGHAASAPIIRYYYYYYYYHSTTNATR